MSNETLLAKPTTWLAMVEQTEIWVPQSGVPVALVDMACRYKANVHQFLLRRAPRIAFRYGLSLDVQVGLHDGGQMAHDSLERIAADHHEFVARVGATQWLRETPLLRELLYQSRSSAFDGLVGR